MLAAHATNEQDAQTVGGTDPGDVRMNQVLLVITVTLVALAAVNAIVRHVGDRARLQAHLGAGPRPRRNPSAGQHRTLGRADASRRSSAPLLGIAGGLALFAALSGDETASPPLWQLLAVVPVTVVVMAALTMIPARIGARRPAAEVLQAELA